MIGGILLAAGNSERMGEPKALLPYKGSSFIDTILNNLSQAGCKPIISILGKSAELICKQTAVDNFMCFQNPEPEWGMLSSLKIAIEQLPPACQGFIFALVDQPLVKPSTFKKIYDEAKKHPELIIIPEFYGRHGHPVYFGKAYFAEILDTPNELGARAIIHGHMDHVKYLQVDDEGILKDIDTPQDYQDMVH